jgi:uncharacterized damage-inducible protein DinB
MTDLDLVVRPNAEMAQGPAAAVWMLDDCRSRTLAAVADMTAGEVDELPDGATNSIGAILYHLAGIEVDWLYADVLQESYPEWMFELFPWDIREEDGRLTPAPGFTLDDHLDRLATVRQHLVAAVRGMSEEEYRRERRIESGVTTPEWVFHHLRQHEAEHRGQIQSVRSALES